MPNYPFHLVRYEREGPLEDNSALRHRPFATAGNSFQDDAKRFVPGEQLETAINTAITVGAPLLITGEPGTAKRKRLITGPINSASSRRCTFR